MWWLATLAGALLGGLIASIPGVLLGALMGHLLDRRWQIRSWQDLTGRLFKRDELTGDGLLFVLLGRLAKANGRVLPAHIQQARAEMQRLALDVQGQREAIEAFARGKTARDNLRRPLKRHVSRAEVLLRACWRMAWADGQVSQAERELLLLWGKWLGYGAAEVERLGRDYVPRREQQPASAGGPYQEALRLLGVHADSEPESIKRAYRRLLSRHHPDKLAGSGATAQRIREATDMTRQIQQAYEVIRQRRGFR